MAYTDNEKSTGLDVLTSLATGDLFIVGDVSDSGRAKAITRANTITDFESVIDLANLQGQIDLTTQVTGQLPAANIDITDLTSDATFQSAVNNFVSGGGGGGTGGKPMTFAISSAGSGTLNPTTGYQDREAYAFHGGGVNFYLEDATGFIQRRDISVDWAAADRTAGHALIGNDLYLLLLHTGGSPEARIYKYDASDLSTGGTQMTISGITLTYNVNLVMTSNGSKLYVNFAAGTTADANDIAGFSVAGTTATFVSTVTCGASPTPFENHWAVTSAENYYGFVSGVITQYDNTGTLTYTSAASGASGAIINWDDTLYVGDSSNGLCIKLFLPDTEIAPTGILSKKVTITSSEILNLLATPKQILPAPGAGKVIQVLSVMYVMNAGATPYADGGVLNFEEATSGEDIVQTVGVSFVRSATDAIKALTVYASADIDLHTNNAIQLRNGGGVEYTAGDGTMDVYVQYRIITI